MINKKHGISSVGEMPCFLLFELECSGIKLIVGSFFFYKLFVISSFNDSTVVKHHYNVRVHYGGKSVSDNEYGSAFHKLIHALLNNLLGSGIN